MRTALFLAFLLVGSKAAADCSLPSLKNRSNEHPECLFYVGTKNFREKNYAAAFGSWERLRNLEEIPSEFQEYKIDAHNNLGFLHYMGWGTNVNTLLAIEYWKLAYDAGHAESTYHLCHAYGDKKRPEYSPQVALGYCEEAIRRYGKEAAREDPEVLRQLRKYIAQLKAR
jgi:TPR repeat protein